jgi:biotin carboxylase
MQKDIILTINVVEPALVRAVNLLSEELGYPLKGLVLVDKSYADHAARPKDYTDVFEEIICDFNDIDELQQVLKPYLDRLLAATCRYEEAIQPFSKVIPFLPYIYTPIPESLHWSTEKPLMRDRLRNYDPDLVPKYTYLEEVNLPDLDKKMSKFDYPVVIKPSGLSESLLVTPCYSFQELSHQLDKTFKVIHEVYDRDRYPGKPAVLVEEMMEGEMYSVDAYVMHNGKTHFLPPVRVITGHQAGKVGFYGHELRLPSMISEEDEQGAFKTTAMAIHALNLRSTTIHIELYKTQSGWKVIEIAARIGGNREIIYREAYGLEHFKNDLLIRMGKTPKISRHKIKDTAVLRFYADTEGTIKAIRGIEDAGNLSSVFSVSANAHLGDQAKHSTNGGKFVVKAFLSNADKDQLEKDIKSVRELICIEVS